MEPKVIVCYDRIPYIYKQGNVRVTFDSNVRTGLYHDKLFDGNNVTIPAEEGTIILEVKYDAFLPGVIQNLIRQME